MIPFPEHGEYRVGIDGMIILFQAFGNWNREGSLSCTRSIHDLVNTLEGRGFGVLIDSFDFEGVTDDGYSDWYEEIHSWKENNLISVARVDNVNSVHYKVFLKPFDALFRELTQFKNVKSYKEAFDFLWESGLKGFESGISTVVAHSATRINQTFRVP